jgi:MFS family permease
MRKQTKQAYRNLPTTIWVLGFVSMLMDISSEMIHGLLALISKVFSGVLSDYLGRRKLLVVTGYALATATKPLFALASSAGLVFTARFVDRVGKGIRGAPRDALIADVTPADSRGAAFGLRQSLDTVGALAGPMLAIGLMLLWAGDFRAVFWVALIPALLALLLLLVGVREPQREAAANPVNPLRWRELRRLGSAFWWVVAIGAAFSLARFSEAFLVLRAQQGGLALAWIPAVLVIMNLVYALTAYPAGSLSDRVSPSRLLVPGLAVLIAADLVLAHATGWTAVLVGVALWGLHLGLTQGLLAKLVADTAPVDLRGTAFGFFNLLSGFALLLSSVLAGLLWDRFGAAYTFYAGILFCLLALLAIVMASARHPPHGRTQS